MDELLLALGLEALYQQLLPGLLASGAGFSRREFLARPLMCVALPSTIVKAYACGPNALGLVVQQRRAAAPQLNLNGHG